MRARVLLVLVALWCPVGFAGDDPLPPAASNAESVKPAKLGDIVPNAELETVDGKSVRLQSLLDEKPALVIFYRGGWCPFCNKQLGYIKEAQKQLTALGYRILAISPDKPEELEKSVEQQELEYTLLSDSSMTLARHLGIAFKVDSETIEKYKGYGIDLMAASGGKSDNVLPVPSLFIVDQERVIRLADVNPDYKERLEPEKLVELAKKALEKP